MTRDGMHAGTWTGRSLTALLAVASAACGSTGPASHPSQSPVASSTPDRLGLKQLLNPPGCRKPTWPQLQGDAQHDGQGQGGAGALSIRWARTGQFSGGAVILGDDVLVGEQGGVADLATSDGIERWHWATADQKGGNIGPPATDGCSVAVVESRPDQGASGGVHAILHEISTLSHELIAKGLDIPAASAGGVLVTGSSYELVGGTVNPSGSVSWGLYAVDTGGGATSVVASLAGFTPGPPAADGGTTFVDPWDNTVQAIDPSGQQIWKAPTSGLPLTTPVVSGARVLVGTMSGVDAFEEGTGRVLWSASVASGVVTAPLPTSDGLLVVDRTDHKLHRLDLASGHEMWAIPLGATLAPPVVVGSRVITVDEQGTLLAVNVTTGAILQRLTLQSGVRAALAVGGGILYAVGSDGGLTAISLG